MPDKDICYTKRLLDENDELRDKISELEHKLMLRRKESENHINYVTKLQKTIRCLRVVNGYLFRKLEQ